MIVGSDCDKINLKITIDEKEYSVEKDAKVPISLNYDYFENEGKDIIEIRFDKVSSVMPMIYFVAVR